MYFTLNKVFQPMTFFSVSRKTYYLYYLLEKFKIKIVNKTFQMHISLEVLIIIDNLLSKNNSS